MVGAWLRIYYTRIGKRLLCIAGWRNNPLKRKTSKRAYRKLGAWFTKKEMMNGITKPKTFDVAEVPRSEETIAEY